jgi:hypothetical protein
MRSDTPPPGGEGTPHVVAEATTIDLLRRECVFDLANTLERLSIVGFRERESHFQNCYLSRGITFYEREVKRESTRAIISSISICVAC